MVHVNINLYLTITKAIYKPISYHKLSTMIHEPFL